MRERLGELRKELKEKKLKDLRRKRPLKEKQQRENQLKDLQEGSLPGKVQEEKLEERDNYFGVFFDAISSCLALNFMFPALIQNN